MLGHYTEALWAPSNALDGAYSYPNEEFLDFAVDFLPLAVTGVL
jgi:hypothetical protein